MADFTLDEVCVVACAEAWRGDGELLASAFGAVPTVGVRLAKATFEPDLLVTDGEAYLVANALPLGASDDEKVIEGWLPFRTVFELVWAGQRHAMLGASQLDRYGNSNISCIGEWKQPKAQLIGARGAPGNTVNHPTSYWVPNHSPRVFVERVDFVSGIGYDRSPGPYELRRVVTNLGVLDFEAPEHILRLRSVHPDVSVDEVQAATGFPLEVPDDVPETRAPTDEELDLIGSLDPKGARHGEVPT